MTAERVEPATSTHVEVRRGVYYDSVTLMRVSRQLSGRAEVSHALTAMATELNRELLVQMGFEPPADAGPTDLLVAIRTVDQAVLADAREALDALLTDASRAPVSEPGPGDLPASRTIGSAAGRADATLALVSVPGQYAFIEAMDALSSGLSVMIFSDNVPVEEEIALKEEAARRDLLVMGPDCGTAVVGGAGLG
ncbi:FdrA family protein, partial [Actinomadura sp. HBU206391]|nr:FdrA family protein [Actinomadura sp. HBU206391]